MTIRQEADILYRYIVQKVSMPKIEAATGIKMSQISELAEQTGFNRDRGQRCNFQGGEDWGRYAPGKPAARGLRITREMIMDYLEDVDYWDRDFGNYVAAMAEEMAEEQHQKQLYEQERREQEELQRRQAAREEQYRCEQAARAEAARREAEAAAARYAAEQAAKAKQYPGYIEQGVRFLNAGKIKEAYDAFCAAKNCRDTYEVRAYLAEALAQAGNAQEHANTIIQELETYQDFLKKNGRTLTADQLLYLARAYCHVKNRGTSCYYYLLAAEPFYNAKDFARADAIYTENDKMNNSYTAMVQNSAFKMAYARAQKSGLNQGDYQYCVKWYTVAIERGQQTPYAYANRSYHNRMLGDLDEAIDDAREALALGLFEPYVYKNLIAAMTEGYEGNGLLELLADMDRRKIAYDPWVKGWAIEMSEDHEDKEAIPYYQNQLLRDPNHKESLRFLTVFEPDHTKATEYGLRYLKIAKKDEIGYQWICEATLIQADVTHNEALIEAALQFNPEEKAKRQAERIAREEARRRAEAEQKRLEQERMRLEEERRRAAEAKRLAEEAEQRRIEAERRAEEERQKAERERQRKEEETLLALLF